jgi:inner membrane protein
MDSVTQAALGASIAHLCWHKNFGKKAFLSGAVLGTIPDLDVVFYPFLNQVQRLYWHRGESHSVFFILIASFFLTLGLQKKASQYNLSRKKLFTGLFLIFSTHVAIDFFTVYGTQILAPLSRYGFASANLYIIDPLYTIPLIAGIFTALLSNKNQVMANRAGLILSSFYILFSLASHSYADQIFKKQLKNQNIKTIRSITAPTPFNTILWRHIALTEKGILIGYFSIIKDNSKEKIEFEKVLRNEKLVKPFENQKNFIAVNWFSKGFWSAKIKNNVVTVSDLRFGEFRPFETSHPDQWEYIFTWELNKNTQELIPTRNKNISYKKSLSVLWEKLKN